MRDWRGSGKALILGSVAMLLLGVGVIGASFVVGNTGATLAAASAEVVPVDPPKAPLRTDPQILAAQPQILSERADPEWVKTVSGRTGIPARALAAYAGAAIQVAAEAPGCSLGWNTLAGIGHVESEHGTIGGAHIDAAGNAVPVIIGIALDGRTTDAIPDTDGGTLDGDSVWDHAVGPMQFIPSTWATWGADGNGDGAKNPQNIDDSALAAARYLCDVGGDLSRPERWIAAVAAYNNTVEYNNRVAEAASHYGALG
ncbi:transglycosylase SLT domain-containing protein [Leucobacter insecticola]|uniref:Transglycosylase SLT domain-containing protein n=1 Tax=Leucobacter insecticola TaxID=2714934 RepID=A0A6G8FLU1_9MICO|nr:lytic murein transglycosylase [Leucobacter insecticola]QIM17052.1 transglycosylase SLT domain-containing protein [Leucobacter insecticola]